MKKKLAFLAAMTMLLAANLYAQDTIPTLTIDSTLTVGDSAVFNRNIRVEGETYMREDATASRDLTVQGTIYYPGAAYAGDGLRDIVVYNPETKALEKITLTALQLEISKFECTTVNGVVLNPTWMYGPNKIFYDCDVNTGLGLSNPLERLHVSGNERVDGFARISDRFSLGADPSTFSRAFIKTNNYGAGLEIDGSGNTGSYPKLILLRYSTNEQTELIKATNTTLNYDPFILTGAGAMTIKNGTATTFQLASDGQLILRNGATGEKTFQFDINGKFRARRVRVDAETWADKVFEPNYDLLSLDEVEKFILENKHLPDVPSEKTVLEEGIDIAEMNKILLQKVEELTLYLLDQNKDNERLLSEVEALKQRIAALESTGN